MGACVPLGKLNASRSCGACSTDLRGSGGEGSRRHQISISGKVKCIEVSSAVDKIVKLKELVFPNKLTTSFKELVVHRTII
jgi:hypothetical protein